MEKILIAKIIIFIGLFYLASSIPVKPVNVLDILTKDQVDRPNVNSAMWFLVLKGLSRNYVFYPRVFEYLLNNAYLSNCEIED
jgi:hypothetical protein